jgi:hypothetical protein
MKEIVTHRQETLTCVETRMRGENGILLVDIGHGCEKLGQAIYGIQNKGINLGCATLPHSNGSNQCRASKPIGDDSYPKRGTFGSSVMNFSNSVLFSIQSEFQVS